MATKKQTYRYYNIPIPMFPASIKLCFSETEFKEILKDHNIEQKVNALDIGIAESHYITDGKKSLIIAIFDMDECEQHPSNPFFLESTVCHEAVHLCQRVFDSIGEETVGEEIRAYITEYIFSQIMKGIKLYGSSGKRSRKVPNDINKKVIGALLQMAEQRDGSAGSDSNSEPKSILRGTKNNDGGSVSKTSRRIRRSG